ncbi:hypothetical protein D3C78_457990 [compost metagenome]
MVVQLEVGTQGHQLQGPVVVEAVFQFGKGVQVAAVPAVPVGAQVGAAAEGQGGAGGVGGQVAPGAGGVELGPLDTGGQRGAVVQVEGQRAAERFLALHARVLEQVAVVMHGDHPPAHVAGFGQRAGDIGHVALGIPRAQGHAARSLEVMGRALAHQVHRARRVAGATQHAGGAAQHFGAVDERRVGLDERTATAALHHGGAVVLDGIDGKATRVVLHPLAVGVVDHHAGCLLQQVGQVGDVLVIDALAGYHTDRLRGMAQGLRHLADGHFAGSVGAGVLGGFTQAVAGNAGRAQLKGVSHIQRRDQQEAGCAFLLDLHVAALQQDR